MDVVSSLPPGWVMMLGGALLPLIPRRSQAAAAVLLPIVSLGLFWGTPVDPAATAQFMGLTLSPVCVDSLSTPFVIVFHIAAIIAAIYALHVRDTVQHAAAMIYAGSAIAACVAGDLLSLFVYWELTAVASVALIWATRTTAAYQAGIRYLIIQVGSGVLLLSGAILQWVNSGTLRFGLMIQDDQPMSPAAVCVLLALGIKAAFPLLHNWLQDAYPQATVTGTVYLSGFTTKLAIYALARGFAGLDLLVTVGCVMTLFPIVFAVIENDLRRVLSYSLNNQLGFMVVGIGIGSELAINGTVAHAFSHIIYKSLLFMSIGAVLYRTGTANASELGGLHRSMPWTTAFGVIGAAAISGFPLLSGFVSKSMIITAAGEAHLFWVWIVLLIASAGVMEHSGIKIPFFAFFAHDSGRRVAEAPWNMLSAMAIAAAACVGLGVAYPLLYRLLPYDADYHPFTVTHVVTQLQLLMFAALAFVVLIKSGFYPAERRATNLDTDWVYRRGLPAAMSVILEGLSAVRGSLRDDLRLVGGRLWRAIGDSCGRRGVLGRTWSTGTMAFWAATLLAFSLVMYYL